MLNIGIGIAVGLGQDKSGTPSTPANISAISTISIDPGGTYSLADAVGNGPIFDIYVWAYTNASGYKLTSAIAVHGQKDISGDVRLPFTGKLSATWPAVSGADGYLVQVVLQQGNPPGTYIIPWKFWDNGNSTSFDDHTGLAYTVNSPIAFYPLSFTQGSAINVAANTANGTWPNGTTLRYHAWTYSQVPIIGKVYSPTKRTATPDVNVGIVGGNNQATITFVDTTEGADGIVLFRSFNSAGFIERKDIAFTSLSANGTPGTMINAATGSLVVFRDDSTVTGWGAGTEPPI